MRTLSVQCIYISFVCIGDNRDKENIYSIIVIYVSMLNYREPVTSNLTVSIRINSIKKEFHYMMKNGIPNDDSRVNETSIYL